DARPAIPEQGRESSWDRTGRPQALALLAPPVLASPSSTARPSSRPSSPSSYPASRPSAPSVLQGLQPRPITLRLTIPPSALAEESDDDMPAVLAPDFAEDGARRSTVPPPSQPVEEFSPPRPAGILPPALPAPMPPDQQWGVRPEKPGPAPSSAFEVRAALPPPGAPRPIPPVHDGAPGRDERASGRDGAAGGPIPLRPKPSQFDDGAPGRDERAFGRDGAAGGPI